MNLKLLAATLAAGLSFAAAANATTYTFRTASPGMVATPAAPAAPVAPSNTYATWNPSDAGKGFAFSNNNLTATSSGGVAVRATIGKSSGKWYYEEVISTATSATSFPSLVGIATSSDPLSTSGCGGPGDYLVYGTLEFSGSNCTYSSFSSYSWSSGVTIGVAVDLDKHTLTLYDNGQSLGTAFASIPAGTYYPMTSDPGVTGKSTTETANFGATPFSYPVPSGYNAGWYNSN